MMKKSRFLVLVFAGLAGLFLVGNFVVWNLWVADLRTTRYAGGDLARMGYVHGSKMPRQAIDTLPRKRLEFSDYRGQEIDIVTIGDSFSSPIGLGENCYYQDHIATRNNLRVLNIRPIEGRWYAPQITFVKLYNSGFFDRVSPRAVIIESIERSIIQRFGAPLDFSLIASEDDYRRYRENRFELTEYQDDEILAFRFVSMANFKFILNLLTYPWRETDIGGRVYHAQLNKDFFSVENASTLLYLDDDIKNLRLVTPETVAMANANLNQIAEMLKGKGVDFYFLPVVDKFDLYRRHVDDERLPKSRFFEIYRELPKNYFYIDTKAILSEELEKGTKDIFFADDSHWSAKAVEAVFSHFRLP